MVAEERRDAYDGSSEADNPLGERTSVRVTIATADLRVTNQFGVQAALTVPDITRTVSPRPSTPAAGSFEETFSGLGDTSLVAWYRLRPKHRWNIVLNAGASVPTGRTERPRFRPGLQEGSLVPMSRLQRGSGSVDPILGVNVDRRVRQLTVFGSVATRLPVFENRYGLRTGASWEVNGGAARVLGSSRLVGFGRLGWLHRRQDVFDGTPVLVGGGDWLYVTPGVVVQVGRGFNAQAEVKLPVYRHVANRQLDSRAVLQVGLSRVF